MEKAPFPLKLRDGRHRQRLLGRPQFRQGVKRMAKQRKTLHQDDMVGIMFKSPTRACQAAREQIPVAVHRRKTALLQLHLEREMSHKRVQHISLSGEASDPRIQDLTLRCPHLHFRPMRPLQKGLTPWHSSKTSRVSMNPLGRNPAKAHHIRQVAARRLVHTSPVQVLKDRKRLRAPEIVIVGQDGMKASQTTRILLITGLRLPARTTKR